MGIQKNCLHHHIENRKTCVITFDGKQTCDSRSHAKLQYLETKRKRKT